MPEPAYHLTTIMLDHEAGNVVWWCKCSPEIRHHTRTFIWAIRASDHHLTHPDKVWHPSRVVFQWVLNAVLLTVFLCIVIKIAT